jgi:phosphonate transport system substrate-binding protein
MPRFRSFLAIALAATGIAIAAPAAAADDCKNRGELDSMYCDANGDMVADAPTDAKKWKNPSMIVFTYTPVEDPAVYENIFKPFTTYLAKCLDKKVVFYQVQSNAAEIEAMRSGRLHVGGFSTGPTAFAVNLAGAVPFAVKGDAKGFQGYNLIVIVKANSPYQKLSDLKGKKVAHTSPSSNSGHLAPLALFPNEGLAPDKDYKIIFSGKHDQSVMGVNSGDYDAAAVASDVFHRMAERGQVKEADFRIIYRSQKFPTSSFAYAHDLEPKLVDKMLSCFYDYRYPAEMQKAFDGADRFVPINYKTTWEVVRAVAKGSGQGFDKATTTRRPRAEARAAAKKSDPRAAERRVRARRVMLELRNLSSRTSPAGCWQASTWNRTAVSPRSSGSGTGKSTLIRCINRLVEPPAAADRVRERRPGAVVEAARHARRQIGMFRVQPGERLTVMENLLCGRLGHLAVAGVAAPIPARRHRAPTALDVVGRRSRATRAERAVRRPAAAWALRAR